MKKIKRITTVLIMLACGIIFSFKNGITLALSIGDQFNKISFPTTEHDPIIKYIFTSASTLLDKLFISNIMIYNIYYIFVVGSVFILTLNLLILDPLLKLKIKYQKPKKLSNINNLFVKHF